MESDLSGLPNLKISEYQRDIREIDIDTSKNPAARQKDFLRKTGSKNVCRVGDITVNCAFGNMNLEKMLDDLINGR